MLLKPEDRRARELASAVLGTLRSIEEQLRCLTEVLKPNQEHENSTSSDTSTGKKQTEPGPIITVHAITKLGDTDAKKQDADRYANNTFQQKSLFVQWCLFAATFAAFAAAAIYALIAKQQLATMTETLEEAHIQNVAQQRALLGVDGGHIALLGGKVGIRIKNQGRMVGKIVSCHMKYEQFRSNSTSLVREEDEQVNALVAPEEPLVLSFTPPQVPPLTKGERIYIRLDIYIAYDDGFEAIQHISPCLSYNVAQDTWDQSCLSTYPIDLSKGLPNDIWLPPKTKK
ncbi:MAG: hypothetical protein JO185_23245 [Acidobacteriaceae bacterium]|nr:hypothetical protein [Acidobacteriaceae bacterium]